MSLLKSDLWNVAGGGTYNVLDYGVNSVPGTTDMTAAIQAAVNAAAAESVVFIPDGNYKITGTILVNKSNLVIRGAGQLATTIFCTASGSGFIAFKFLHASSYGTQCTNVGIVDLGIKTTETTYTKTAIQMIDCTNSFIERVSINNWYGGDSVGLQFMGRQLLLFSNSSIVANVPIRISENPAYASARLSLDGATFQNLELISLIAPSTLTNAIILVDNDTQVANVNFSVVGMVGAVYGFYWTASGSPAFESYALKFTNCRKEGGTSAAGYSVYISATTAAPVRNVVLDSCVFEIDTGQGVYTNYVTAVTLLGCSWFGATNTNAWNVSNCHVFSVLGLYVNNNTKTFTFDSSMKRVWSANTLAATCPSSGVWTNTLNTGYLTGDLPRREGQLHVWDWTGQLADDTSLEIFDNTSGKISHGTLTMSGSCSALAGGGVWHMSAKAIGTNGVLLLSGTNADDADVDGNLICYSNTASLAGPILIRNRLGATADISLRLDFRRTSDV